MTTNPFVAGIEMYTEGLERTAEIMGKNADAPEQLEQLAEVDVGQTPSRVVYEENKLELLHYESMTEEQHDVPILIVYALINRPYILDLQPDRSVVRTLLENGFDVYLIDWNEPSQLDTALSLDDYVNRYIDNCVDVVRERSGQDSINVLGYCMGGTMSVMYAALYPEKVRNLGLMAAGLCFTGTGGVLERWGDEEHYSPETLAETYGNVPAEFLDVGFAIMDPVQNFVTKYFQLYDNLENDDFVENFGRMEKWLNDGIDVAGQAYVEFLRDIYQENKLHRNELYLGGEHVDLDDIDMPVLQIMGKYDHLIPPEASKPFNEVVASDDTEAFEFPTGHIGLSVSSKSHAELWPQVCEWFAERSGAEEEPLGEDATGEGEDEPDAALAEDVAGDEAGTEEVEDPDLEPDNDLETVDGIGPTYAERLGEAGVADLDVLVESDPDEIADAAGVSADRARDWIDQAEDLTAE